MYIIISTHAPRKIVLASPFRGDRLLKCRLYTW